MLCVLIAWVKKEEGDIEKMKNEYRRKYKVALAFAVLLAVVAFIGCASAEMITVDYGAEADIAKIQDNDDASSVYSTRDTAINTPEMLFVDSIRVYGNNSYDAAFPFTDPEAPFDPTSVEAPIKDFITSNPAYMYHFDPANDFFFMHALVVDGCDANEKVFLRQWYVPEYPEPRGTVWTYQEPVPSPDIVNEYTYMFLDMANLPVRGTPMDVVTGAFWTSFVFPLADNSDDIIGLDGYDANGDGNPDRTILRGVSDYDGDGLRDVDISTDALHLARGDTIKFLDHEVTIMSITAADVVVDVYYTGNDCPERIRSSVCIPTAALPNTVAAGPHSVSVGVLPTAVTQPWYLAITSVNVPNEEVVAFAGRVLITEETFFVDCAEYDVAMIYGPTPLVPGTNNDLKYITIRNPLPLYDMVLFPTLTAMKCPVQEDECLPLLPPFNTAHDIIGDINIKHDDDCLVLHGYSIIRDELIPGDLCIDSAYDTVFERRVEDLPPLDIRFLEATDDYIKLAYQNGTHLDYLMTTSYIANVTPARIKFGYEPNSWNDVQSMFHTSLLEIYDETLTPERSWKWLHINATPDNVTEFLETYFEFQPNLNPIANFSYSPEKPVVNETITFDASNSTDPDGFITEYEWDFGDGNVTSTSEEIIIHSYSSSRDYTVNLTVTDNEGAINSTSKAITIYSPAIIYVPDDYAKIQWAVDNASAGDTIIVRDGTYNENIDVDKTLSLIGEGLPTIDAQGEEDAIKITANNCVIKGFRCVNATYPNAGIRTESNRNIIENNTCENNEYGIHLYYSSDNIISKNNISNNDRGIYLRDSSNNNIINNVILNNSDDGIHSRLSNNNVINNNNIVNNHMGIEGYDLSNNIISNNNISNNGHGICLNGGSYNNISNNEILNNRGAGIQLSEDSYNMIINNTFENDGLSVRHSYQNTVENNTVNGKPLVYLEDESDYTIIDAGQVILVNCNNITIENLNLSDVTIGIELWRTRNSKIMNNNISPNNGDGIALDYSSNNIISNNIILNNGAGIVLTASSNNNISNNNISQNRCWGIFGYASSSNNIISNNIISSPGIYDAVSLSGLSNSIINNIISSNDGNGVDLYRSSNSIISNNNISSNNGDGIDLYRSSNSIISNNTFMKGGLFIGSESYQNIVENNTVNGKPLVYLEDISDYTITDAGQVILVNCNNITAEYLDLSNTSVGVELLGTNNSKIMNNNISSNNDRGIYLLYYSSNNIISKNNISNNIYGVYLYYSSNNTINKNNISNNIYGVYLYSTSPNNNISNNVISSNNNGGISSSSSNNIIISNNISDNRIGIGLCYSSNNSINNNTFVNDGLSVSNSFENTVENNIVNSKPLVYLEDVSDYTIIDAGQVILVNCNNITAEYLDLSNASIGIKLWGTDNSKIINNIMNSNGCSGIYLYSSSNNTLTNNIANLNGNDGICLHQSSNNILTNNTANSNNNDGICLPSSSNNTIYLNNFINNTNNVYSYDSTNIWNSTSKITYTYNSSQYTNCLGNHWGDYTGNDTNKDGIGDTPYDIDSDKDNYPLMQLWENYLAPAPSVFDTGAGTYPSIRGTHNGTITPSDNITVSKLYTYPCAGTGGHTKSIKLYDENDTLIANGSWNGYIGDYHNLTIHNLTGETPYVTLLKNHEYRYAIKTGSYPQIIHEPSKDVTGGTITCTSFVDANGKIYTDWIPAIRLYDLEN